MYKYLLIPLAIFVTGCQPPPTHKIEGYVTKADEPIKILEIKDIDKLEGKWWEKEGEEVGFAPWNEGWVPHRKAMDKLQEGKYYIFWYHKKHGNGKKYINSARMPIEINRKLEEKRANYKEETVQEGE